MSNEMNKAVPGFVIGTAIASLFSPAVAVVAGCAVMGGIVTYVINTNEENKK